MTVEAVNLPLLAIGLTLSVLSVAALVVLRRRRRAAAPAEAVECDVPELAADDELMDLLELEEYEVAAMAEMVELLELNAMAEETDSATVRALRAQVRTLEQALEAAPEISAVPAVVTSAVEQSYRNQVLLAARAVAARTGDDTDPRHAAARVVAAVERLEVAGFTRPVLPGIESRAVAVPPPLPPAQAAAVAPTPAAPVLPAAPDLTVEVVDELPEEPQDEVVVPVPPPAAEEPKRGRRRLRGSAA